MKKWHEVYPVNPKEDKIEGLKCYRDISGLPDWIEVLNIVTTPKVTMEVLKAALSLWYLNVWCQPWASDEDIKKFLQENDFKFIVDSCIMTNS